jgi:uncharacterized coiled-coil DUF342 family protein|tara:strand:- start:2304 stop:3143 length:840 start_codon:yes stop_codon:yes gene_type:complete
MENINQKITSLLTYRSGLIKEIKTVHEKRKDLKDEIRGLSKKINETRKNLEEGYGFYQDTRKIRRETLSKIRELRLKIQTVEKDSKKFERDIPNENGNRITEMLKDADWKIQTEKLTIDEEKQLVQIIKDLELNLRKWKKAYETRKNIYNLRAEMEKLKDKMDDINLSNEESELEIETEKNRFTYDLKARDQLFKEINEINDEILELEEAIAKTDEQLEEIREKRRDMISLGKEQEKEKFRIKEQELLVKAKSIAKDKVSKGEKLTFEELKLVYGNELE